MDCSFTLPRKKKPLLEEGNYIARVASVQLKPNRENPKKAVVGFKIDNYQGEVLKEMPLALEVGAPLRKDMETILAKRFTDAELEGTIRLGGLVGKPCQVVVMHKAAAGGKPMAVVGLVLPAAATAQNPSSN